MPASIAFEIGWASILFCAAFGYLSGSIPFGLILTRVAGLGDIRKIGSGNIGATNVLRTGRKDIAAATLMLDACKAALPTLVVAFAFYDIFTPPPDAAVLDGMPLEFFDGSLQVAASGVTGLAAVLGHMFPVWLGFRGGKGVASGLAVCLALEPLVGVAALMSWAILALASRYSSFAALGTFALVPFYFHFFFEPLRTLGILLAILIWIKHRANIVRLFKGEEPRIGKKAA